uniref:DUF2428 domain-containing protein n=1 Tax=Drosophila melanogaster TaxID=7227 RepID=Q9VB48_DROME|nr:uncharacterized protein Dmel_CG3368 [Drosophila melanogaster]AAF56695.2 uncharacterized protein Dmel_CG3368 [Drosophila melanogaster]|eukprot:NP_651555.1 uncharacterized protein Dmel_CG3368 [Drosophila melanogaster]
MSESPGKRPKIGPSDCLCYLQGLGDVRPEDAALQLAQRIQTEEDEAAQADTCSGANQAALNISFRVYYHIVHKYELQDSHFADLFQRLTSEQPTAFLMLQSILLTDHWKRLDAALLEEKCTTAIIEALQRNNPSLMAVLKATNLLVKKFPKLQLLPLKLEHFYHCLQRQTQTGSREETLTLYNHCCKQPERAFSYFRLIVEFWPWTNRNKYYLLSGALNSHSLPDLLAATNQSEEEFFNGLRLSLSYKGLRAASQYPVKSLSNQRSPALLAASVELLLNGSVAEIQNFHSQWFLRIQQREELFELLQANPQIVEFLATEEERSPSDQLRLILIFSMFAREIYATSKLHFFKISTELLTNCSQMETEAQLLIFRFLVDNLGNFAVEDCLDFFHSFVERHRCLESSEFRNTMLGKMPTIINHTAKHFQKVLKADIGVGGHALAQNIKRFFSHLQHLIERDIHSEVYQPKIFALKLLEILNRSLYAEEVAKNAKMCSPQQNQRMGIFLLEHGVFRPKEMAQQLFETLNNPQGFDDALDLTVSLLIQMGHVDSEKCVERCFELCHTSDMDQCSLVSLYAQLAVTKEQAGSKIFDECLKRLTGKLDPFFEDPLQTAKSGGHLFGYLCALDEVVKAGLAVETPLEDLLPLLERILSGILKFLNVANARRQEEAATAASFQDMDESLQLLVSESSFKCDGEEEACRKYLLMSFWLTLKGCCDLATSIGCYQLQTSAKTVNTETLRRCLNINVSVLTLCRHKGAIEAAGLSIGRLTRAITSSLDSCDSGFQMLHDCLERELLTESRQVSTTRRGAGFAIMFLHVLKNDNPRQRLLLHRAVQQILKRLNENQTAETVCLDSNHDRWEALVLHYLCVLVRDTELRPAMSKYYNEILLVAMEHITNPEWTISNAALQLFGANLGKLVGQRQATEFDTRPAWEPSELDYDELGCLLPKACEHMLRCCDRQEVTSSIILFLAFLSKVEHLRTSGGKEPNPLLIRFRRLSWHLLRHKCDQVRQLAATCFVRSHEFRCDLPAALLASAKLAANLEEENFYEGLIYTLTSGVLKLKHEARHVWSAGRLEGFLEALLTALDVTERVRRFKPYTRNVLLELLGQLGSADKAALVESLG